MDIEEKTFLRNIKGIAKALEISVFGIVKYSAKRKIGYMISLRDKEYYVPGSPKDLS